MTVVDWIALGVIALLALAGLRRGFVVGALSLAGLLVGAWVGSRVGPRLLPDDESRWVPVAALVGAVLGGALVQSLGSITGGMARGALSVVPPLRALDRAAGLVLGAVTGLALCWVLAAVALYMPGQTELRREAQESAILSAINEQVPPARVIGALAHVDPLLAVAGPHAGVGPPDPAVLQTSGVREAAQSVVRITGIACGLGIEGTGWIASPGLVVTNAHVVAGIGSPRVDRRDGSYLDASVVAFDRKNDLAVLRVAGLSGRPLTLAEPERGAALALLGFPRNGPYAASPLRAGSTRPVVSRDAYGKFPTLRTVTALRGKVSPGNSGGPAVDGQGRVQIVVFAASTDSEGGYGVPSNVVRTLLAAAGLEPLKTSCTES